MKKLIVSIWPIVFIILVWFLFSYPYFLQYKAPFPSLYAVNAFAPWSAYHVYEGSIKNGAMPDVITQMYPWRYFTIESWKHGQIPLWNPYSFSGTPHLANYQSAVLSPFNLLFFLPTGSHSVLSFVDAWSILVLLQPLLAGIFMYMYVRSMRITKTGSIISSIAFMFCGFMTTWMDYATLGYAIVFLPLALFAIEKFIDTNKMVFLILLSLSIPLSFFSGHFQISLYFLIFILVYLLYHLFWKGGWQVRTVYLILAVAVGLLLAMPQILPSLEFYNQSLRSNLFQQIEAIPIGYLPTFISPDFFGNPVTRNDWFGHYAEWNGYIGLLPFMLAVYVLFSRFSPNYLRSKSNQKKLTMGRKGKYANSTPQHMSKQIWFFGIVSIIVLLFAFSTPVLTILIALHIPVLSTSAASRIIVLFSFIFAVLGGFGFDMLADDMKNRRIRPIVIWIISFFIVFFILWMIIVLKLFLSLEERIIAKQNLILPTVIFFIGITIVLAQLIPSYDTGLSRILLFSARYKSAKSKSGRKQKKKSKKSSNAVMVAKTLFLSSCFLLLISFDMLRFAIKWQPFDPKQFVFPQTPVMSMFTQNASYERIVGDDGAEVSVYNQVPSVEGYDPLYIKRYGELIGSLDGTMNESARSVVSLPKDAQYTPQALTLLDVKYILQKNSDNNKPWGFPFANYPEGQFGLSYNDGSYQLFKNNLPIQHIFLAQHYLVKTNSHDILTALFAQKTTLQSTVVLEKDPHIAQGGVIGNAQITDYSPNNITILAQTSHPALLFLSEVFYPGWQAYVDGKSTEIYRADYTFRSIVVPQGKHTIIFEYKPMSFTAGMLLCFLGIVGLLCFPFIRKHNLLQ